MFCQQTPGAVLNSEGDEWIEVDPLQKEPTPPVARIRLRKMKMSSCDWSLPAAVLPEPEAALGVALDKARQAGPEAVLAFVASQPDSNLPLLVAAAGDAQNELIAPASTC